MSNKNDLTKIKQFLDSAENSIRDARALIFRSEIGEKARQIKAGEGDIVEGIFDGEKMVSSDGKEFEIPANYASKSKLVTGDILKLTILEDGSFQFKQIGPIERKKLIGSLVEHGAGKYSVECGKDSYLVLHASITYYKAEVGDKLTISVPANQPAEWGAVENKIL